MKLTERDFEDYVTLKRLAEGRDAGITEHSKQYIEQCKLKASEIEKALYSLPVEYLEIMKLRYMERMKWDMIVRRTRRSRESLYHYKRKAFALLGVARKAQNGRWFAGGKK
jgi:hypothetical protein